MWRRIGVLWPNGWIDQDETWRGRRPRQRLYCVDGDPAPLPKGAQSPIFGPCLSWPNNWLDQDATSYGCRPRPRRQCVRLEPIPQKGGQQPPTFRPMYCDQTAGWIKVPLRKEVGLGPGHIVLDGDPTPHLRRGTAPTFRPIFIVTKRLEESRYHLVRR